MNKKNKIIWSKKTKDRDYSAAASYLSLIYSPSLTKKLVERLQHAPLTLFYSKDVFRASELALLGPRNSHVRKVRAKISRGHKISPILLVRNEQNGKVVIADGYHRMCAVYSIDEDAILPCRII